MTQQEQFRREAEERYRYFADTGLGDALASRSIISQFDMQVDLERKAWVAAREYSAAEAVEMLDWIDKMGYYHLISNDHKWFENDGELVAENNAELYQLFLNSNPRP